MIYSDRDILRAINKQELNIEPFDNQYLQPASYDVHLYPTILRLASETPVDLNDLDAVQWTEIEISSEGLTLYGPDMFVLLSTVEKIRLSRIGWYA